MTGEDRLSGLSNDVLSKILSFLELRDAAKTSVLSQRWKKVWAFNLHRVYLDNQFYLGKFYGNLSWEEDNKRRIRFSNLVNQILTAGPRYNNNNRIFSSVTSFSLRYYFAPLDYSIDQELFVQWIAAALSISPKLEDFDFGVTICCVRRPPIKMPHALYQCKNLVTLELRSSCSNMIYLDVPETVSLGSLEKLHLAGVQFKDDNSLKNLLSGCCVLEQLHMTEIRPYGAMLKYSIFQHAMIDYNRVMKQNLLVSSPSLKILKVRNLEPYPKAHTCYVVEAPKLEYIDFVERSLGGFAMTASPSLVSAVIDICRRGCSDQTLSVIELFQGISNVQNLELSTSKIIMHKDELANLPEFHNLISLKIGRCENKDIIPCFLLHSPYIKHLIFDEFLFRSKAFMWSPPEGVPKCLTFHLETIEICSVYSPTWRRGGEAVKMIEYVLDKGKVLRKRTITSEFLDDEELLNKFSESQIVSQLPVKGMFRKMISFGKKLWFSSC